MKMRIIFCISVCLLMVALPFLPVNGEGEIYEKVLRLHVLANSDSTEDQQVKLLVRDALVAKAEELARECSTAAEAESVYENNLHILRETAENVISAQGYNYGAEITLVEEYYPERQYGDLRLPSGRYNSLKVRIGDSVGQNWWCVLFPPLCVEAAEAEEELAATGFTPGQIKLLTDSETPKYVIRFRVLEWFEDIKELFR